MTAGGRLHGRVALVTGAGRGIGRAVALALAAAGADVVLAARSPGPLEAVAGEAARLGRRALVVPTDVREQVAVEALVRRAVESFDGVDVLVNAAGAAAFGPVADCAPDEWDLVLAVNLRGAFLACRAVIPVMTARGSGTIINVGSVVTTRTLPGSGAYTASKYGLLGLSRVLAEELRPRGVRVGVITSGAVDTPLWDRVEDPPDRRRMLRPEQVAEVAVLMAGAGPDATLEEVVLLPAGGVL